MSKSDLVNLRIDWRVLLTRLNHNGLLILYVWIHDHPRVSLHHSRLTIGLLILHLGGSEIVASLNTGLDCINTSLVYIMVIVVVVMLVVMMLVTAVFEAITNW